MLLLQYIGQSTEEQKAILRDKEKRKIPIPFCCIRFRPSKPCECGSVEGLATETDLDLAQTSFTPSSGPSCSTRCCARRFPSYRSSPRRSTSSVLSVSLPLLAQTPLLTPFALAEPVLGLLCRRLPRRHRLRLDLGRALRLDRLLCARQGAPRRQASAGQVLVDQDRRHAAVLPVRLASFRYTSMRRCRRSHCSSSTRSFVFSILQSHGVIKGTEVNCSVATSLLALVLTFRVAVLDFDQRCGWPRRSLRLL